jgi:transcriptional regulator with XRE-family HTH domain
MGRAKRAIPRELPGKLLQIRLALGESQEGMAKLLNHPEAPGRNYVSGFELGTREPTLTVLARYADIVNCWIDVLVRNELLLPPPPWPCKTKSEGIRREGHGRK